MRIKTQNAVTNKLIVYTSSNLKIKKIDGNLSDPQFDTIEINNSFNKLLKKYFAQREINSFLKKAKDQNGILIKLGNYNITVSCFLLSNTNYYIFIFEPTFILNVTEKSAKDYLANIIRYSPGFFYLKDTKLRYIICNENFANVAGLNSPYEIAGKTDYDLAWGKTEAELFRQGDIEALSGIKKINFEEPQKQADGSTKIVLANKVPLYDSQGNLLGILGNYLDITERKKMKLELITAKEEVAESAAKAKAEFLRNMEHQLRTPFSGVYSLVRMLYEQESDPEKKELLEITYSSGKELLDFLNDVINFSRNQVDTTAILAKKFDLKQLIEKAIALEKPAAFMKGLDLNIDYPDDLPTIFISDPKRIQRIALNLLSNAIKFTTKGAVSVAVKLGKQIDEKNYILRLIFADTGIGIAEENQCLIYEKFYRVFPANQNKYQGAGLGLHIVKELITDLEGEIDLKSYLNEGSTFICTIPLKRPLIDEIVTHDVDSKRGYFREFKRDDS